jgi:hypothetical protein
MPNESALAETNNAEGNHSPVKPEHPAGPLTDEPLPPSIGEKRPSRLAVAKDLTDLLAKAVPLIAGTIYLAGYFVTAGRLADYGVSVTQLVDAQYFIAGLAPGVLFWLTLVVVYSAFRYKPQGNVGQMQNLIGCLLLALFVIGALIEVAGGVLDRYLNLRIFGMESWFDLYAMTLFRAALGQMALWFVITGLRTGFFARMIREYRARELDTSDVVMLVICVLIIAGGMVYSSYGAVVGWYTAIPQAYGGGRPLIIQLYVEREKTPTELLAVSAGTEEGALTYTVPVELIFKASTTFIVDPVDDATQRVWSLDARTVYAVLSSSEGLTDP